MSWFVWSNENRVKIRKEYNMVTYEPPWAPATDYIYVHSSCWTVLLRNTTILQMWFTFFRWSLFQPGCKAQCSGLVDGRYCISITSHWVSASGQAAGETKLTDTQITSESRNIFRFYFLFFFCVQISFNLCKRNQIIIIYLFA